MQTIRPPAVGELYQLIAGVLKVKPTEITEMSSPETIPGWDSLRTILLVSVLEERYQVTLTLAELMTIKTIGDLQASLEHHGISFTA